MSDEAYSYLYLTMNCEMIYIIDQRLSAQGISPVRAAKVLNDILSTIFNSQTIDSILERKPLVTLECLRGILSNIAHSSIMKLNDQSMSKLFDLMVMMSKYQLVCCQNSLELFDMISNHLDTVILLTSNESIRDLIDSAKKKFLKQFELNHIYRLQMVRTTLMAYFIGISTRVSVLIKLNVQDPDGNLIFDEDSLVNCYCQIPGSINYYDESGSIVSVCNFNPGGVYREATTKTTLGLNLYSKELQNDKQSSEKEHESAKLSTVQGENQTESGETEANSDYYCYESETHGDVARKEAHLLAQLIGKTRVTSPSDFSNIISFNIWTDMDDIDIETSDESKKTDEHSADKDASSSQTINLSNGKQYDEIRRIRDEMFSVKSSDDKKSENSNNLEDDLLALVDSEIVSK